MEECYGKKEQVRETEYAVLRQRKQRTLRARGRLHILALPQGKLALGQGKLALGQGCTRGLCAM